MLAPSSSAAFFETTWEKAPLFISRPSLRQWYSDWVSQEQIFDLLARDQLQYGFNLDVTTYNGKVRPARIQLGKLRAILASYKPFLQTVLRS